MMGLGSRLWHYLEKVVNTSGSEPLFCAGMKSHRVFQDLVYLTGVIHYISLGAVGIPLPCIHYLGRVLWRGAA